MNDIFDYNLYERKETSDGYDYYVPYDIEKTTICGKNIKEIIYILNALELERIYEIKMCMENLSKYKKLIDNEMYKNIANSFRKSAESLGLADLESKGGE